MSDFIQMSREELQEIIATSAEVAEKAYRRGFQHGIVLCNECGIDNDHASRFRFGVSLKHSWGAPEKDANGKIHVPWRSINHTAEYRHFVMEGPNPFKKWWAPVNEN